MHTCVASLDVGTTGIRCILYDKKAKVLAESYEKIRIIQDSPGASEIDALELWELAKKVIATALTSAGIGAQQVASLGITTMRSSIVTWDRTSGKPAHRIITWQDTRAQAICTRFVSICSCQLNNSSPLHRDHDVHIVCLFCMYISDYLFFKINLMDFFFVCVSYVLFGFSVMVFFSLLFNR